MMDRPVLIPLPNFHLKVSLPSDIAEFGAFRDTECYLVIFQTIAESVKFQSWMPSLSTEKP